MSTGKTGEPLVELRGVSVSRGRVPVLVDIDLTVPEHDFLAVIGPNGAGKTTLLRVILGLEAPAQGTVRVCGGPAGARRCRIGYLPQQQHLDRAFPIDVLDVVLMGRYGGPLRRYTAEDRRAAMRALERVGMASFRHRQIGALSGGQRQRVLLARALAVGSRLLLLDEPTASVDPQTQRLLYELLAELRSQAAIIMVTHDIGAVSAYVENVACLNRRLYYHGSAEGSMARLDDVYQCPVELLAHGQPHRVMHEHD